MSAAQTNYSFLSLRNSMGYKTPAWACLFSGGKRKSHNFVYTQDIVRRMPRTEVFFPVFDGHALRIKSCQVSLLDGPCHQV